MGVKGIDSTRLRRRAQCGARTVDHPPGAVVDSMSVEVRQRNPTNRVRLMADDDGSAGRDDESVANVEVEVFRFASMRWNRMDVEIDRPGVWRTDRRLQGEPALLENLALRCGEKRCVLGLDVSAGLEPASEPRVVDEQNGVGVGGEHAGGCGEMPGNEVGTGTSGRRLVDEVPHRRPGRVVRRMNSGESLDLLANRRGGNHRRGIGARSEMRRQGRCSGRRGVE